MAQSADDLVLKILNGTQNGVEIQLEAGEYTLGSAADDDLQFVDLALKPGHARLRIGGGSLALKAGAGAVTTSTGLELEPGNGDWHDLDQLDIVTIGTTRFAVGAPTANWAGLIAAAAEALDEPKRARRPRIGAGRMPVAGHIRRLALPVVAFIAVVWFGATTLATRDASIGRLLPAETSDEVTVVSRIIEAFPFAQDVSVEEEIDGTIYVRGYVDELAERRAIINALRDTDVPARVRLWVRSTITNEVANLIAVRDVEAEFTLSDDGVLTLTGIIIDPAEADGLVALMREQLIGVSEVRSEIRTGETILAEVQELARRSGIDRSVLFRRAGRVIEASGAVRNADLDAYLGFLQGYASRFARLMPLRTLVSVEGVTTTERPQALVIAAADEETPPPGRRLSVEALSDLQSSFADLLGAVTSRTQRERLPDEADPTSPAPPAEAAGDGEGSFAGSVAAIDASGGNGGAPPGTAPSPTGGQTAGSGINAAEPAPMASLEDILLAAAGSPVIGSPAQGGSLVVVSGPGGLPDEAAQPLPAPAAVSVGSEERPPSGRPLATTDASGGSSVASSGTGPARTGGQVAASSGTGSNGGQGTASSGTEPGSTGGQMAASSATGPGSAGGQGAGSAMASTEPAPDGRLEDVLRTTAGDAVVGSPPEAAPSVAVTGAGGLPSVPIQPDPTSSVQSAAVTSRSPVFTVAGDPRPLTGTALALARSPASSRPLVVTDPDRQTSATAATAGPAEPQEPDEVMVPAPVSAEARFAFGRLVDATVALIEAHQQSALSVLVDAEREPAVAAAIEAIAPAVRAEALATPDTLSSGSVVRRERTESALLPAAMQQTLGPRACWDRSRISFDMLPVLTFWLDLLSVSESIRLSDLTTENRGLLLEAALSPERLSGCLTRVGTERSLALRDGSIYLAETGRNPQFINYIVRGLENPDLQIVGANLTEERYIQLLDGRNLYEGAAPNAGTRIASIGEVGVLLRSVDGYTTAVYPSTLAWALR